MREKNGLFGHKKLVVWGNINKLQQLIYKNVLLIVPKNQFKLKDQIDRATSSIGANFVEGYYSGSTKSFIQFLNYSRRSLAELEFWIDNCFLKNLISKPLHSSSKDLIIKTGYLIDRLISSLKRKLSL